MLKADFPENFFEYLASRRPILVVGPEESDASKIVHGVNAGYTCDFNDLEKTINTVKDLYEKFRQNNLPPNQTDISQYSNRSLTGKLASYLNEITNTKLRSNNDTGTKSHYRKRKQNQH